MKKLVHKLCLLGAALSMASFAYGQTVRYAITTPEPIDVTMISSLVMHPVHITNSSPMTVTRAATTEDQLQPGDAGRNFSLNNDLGGTRGDGVRALAYADCDDDMTTFQSSAAYLDFGDEMGCTTVQKAFLYWTGASGTDITYAAYPDIPTMKSHAGGTTGTAPSNQVKFKAPGDAAYSNITGTVVRTGSDNTTYVADVTNWVNGKSGGMYWVANVRSQTNNTNATSGWSLVVIFRPPNCPPRVLTLWDGSINEGQESNRLIVPSPRSGNNISYMGFGGLDSEDIAVLVSDAEAANSKVGVRSGGDPYTYVQPFWNGVTTEQPLWQPTPAEGYDGLVSSQTTVYNKATNTNGNQILRIPSMKYTCGYDAHHLRLPPGAITADAGTTGVQMEFPNEQYGGCSFFMGYICVETVQPNLIATKKADTETIGLEGIINYTITVKNKGLGASRQNALSFLTDTLDLPLDFVPGSVVIRNRNNGVITGSVTNAITGQGTDNEYLKVMLPDIAAANSTTNQPTDSITITFQAKVKPLTRQDLWSTGCRRTLQNKATLYYDTADGLNLTGESNTENGCGGGDNYANVYVDDVTLDAMLQDTHYFTVELGQQVADPGSVNIINRVHQDLVTETAKPGRNSLNPAQANGYEVTDMDGNPIAAGATFDPSLVEQEFMATKDVSTDGYECIETFYFTYHVIKVPSMVVTKTDPVCAEMRNGTITVALTNGGSGFAVKIIDPTKPDDILFASRTKTGQATDTYNAAYFKAGTYKVLLEVAGQTFEEQDVTLTDPAGITMTVAGSGAGFTQTAEANATQAGYGDVCLNTAFSLTASGSAASYVWKVSTDSVNWYTAGTGTATLPVSTGIAQKTYYWVYNCNTQCQVKRVYVVSPKPVAAFNPMQAVTCSGASFTVSPSDSLAVTTPGITYRWTAPVNATVNGLAAGDNAVNLTATLTNNPTPPQSSAAKQIIYSLTPVQNGCYGAPFNVTVNLQDKPGVNFTAPAAVCSGQALNPTGLSLFTNGCTIDTQGWTLNGAAFNIADPVTYANNGQMLRYTATNACGTSYREVAITVNPEPQINNITRSICSGEAFTATPANGTDGVVPAGTTYTWTVAENPNVSGEGAQGTPQTAISQTLVNSTPSTQTVVYTVTPKSGNCTGTPFTVTVSVSSPTPAATLKCGIVVGHTTFASASGQTGDVRYNTGDILFDGAGTQEFTVPNGTYTGTGNLADGQYTIVQNLGGFTGSTNGIITDNTDGTFVIDPNVNGGDNYVGVYKITGLTPGQKYHARVVLRGLATVTTGCNNQNLRPQVKLTRVNNVNTNGTGLTNSRVYTETQPSFCTSDIATNATGNWQPNNGGNQTLNPSGHRLVFETDYVILAGDNGFELRINTNTNNNQHILGIEEIEVTGCVEQKIEVSQGTESCQGVEVCQGTPTTLKAMGLGTTADVYEWTRGGTVISGATGNSLRETPPDGVSIYTVRNISDATTYPETLSVTINSVNCCGASAAKFTIPKVCTSPNVNDGVATDPAWNMAPWQTVAINANANTGNGDCNMIGGGVVGMVQTPAGRWRCVYDDTNIYFLVEVNDPTPENNKSNTTDDANSIWYSDAVEIYLANANKSSQKQFGFGYATGTNQKRYATTSGTSRIWQDVGNGKWYLEVSIPMAINGYNVNDPSLMMELSISQSRPGETCRAAQVVTWKASSTHYNSANNYTDVPLSSCASAIPSKDLICAGETVDISTQMSAAGGTTYTWEQSLTGSAPWSPIQGAASPSTANIIINVTPTNGTALTGGKIYYRATHGGIATCPAEVTIRSAITITATTGNSRCGAGSVNLTATTSDGRPVNWYENPTGGIAIDTSNSGDNWATPSISNSTTYYAEAANNTCPGAARTAVTAGINLIPTVDDPIDQTVCNGDNTTAVNFTGNGVAGTTYAWTNTNPTIGLAGSGTGNIAAFSATNSTNAPISGTIEVTPTANGCAGTPQTFTITVNPTPTVNAIGNVTACKNGNVAAIAFSSPVAGTTFTWTNTNPTIGLAANGAGDIPAFTAAAADTATITVTPTAATCAGTPLQFTITVNDKPTLGTVNENELNAVCAGSNLTLNAPTVTDNGSTVSSQGWEIETGAGNNVFISFGSPYTVAYDDSGKKIRYTATNSCGTTTSNEVTITVTDKPDVPAFTAPAKVCEGTALSLTAPTPIDWKSNTTPQTEGWEIELTAGSWTTFNPATAMVYATHNGKQLRYLATNGCGTSYSTTQTIQIDQAVTANAGSVGAISCICATATTTATMNAVAAAVGTGTWTKISGNGGTITNPNLATTTITGLQAGTHTYRWTVTNGLCSAYDEVSFSVTADTEAPTFSLSATTANAASVGSCTFQVPDLSGFVTSKADICTTIGNLVYTQTPAAGTVITAQQIVSITLTDECNNISAAQNVTVNVPAALQITNITVSNPECENDKASAVVTVTGGVSPYQYSLTSAVASDFVALATIANLDADQTVYIKDANGCTTSGTIDVTMVNAITATLTPTDVTTPSGTDGTITVSSPAGGNGAAIEYEYRKGSPATVAQAWSSSASVTGLPSGNYKVYARNAGQICEYDLGGVLIDEPAAIDGTATPTDVTCNGGNDGQIVAEVTAGGTSPYQYQLETSIGGIVRAYGTAKALGLTETFTGLSAGTYQVRVKDDNGAIARIAQNIVVGEPAAMTVANISSPAAVCAGGNLSLTAQVINKAEPAVSSQAWEIETAVGSGTFIAFNNPVTYADNGRKIRYTATNSCREVSSNEVVITVNDKPAVSVNWTQPVCEDDNLTASVTVLDTKGSPVTGYAWKLDGATIASTASLSYLANLADNGKPLTVEVTNGCGTTISGPGTVTINSKPHIGNKTETIDNNAAFSVTPTDGVNGDIVPAGTTYTWTVAPNANVTGASNNTTGAPAPLGQQLTNQTDQTQTVVYTVTPTSGAGCVGATFTITVTITASPAIGNVTRTIDSGNAFTVTPGVDTAINDIVPTGTTYTWTVAPNANINNASAQATGVAAPISQTLTSTTDTQQVIVYTVTPTSNGNVGNTFTITVTVNPRPRIANITTTINSGETFSVSPATGGGASSNDLVPSNTEYTWTVVDNSNVTGESAGSGNAPLGQPLTNTTDRTQTVVYTVTPKAGTATGGSFTISVDVYPQPRIANVATAICTGGTFSVSPATGGGTSSNDLVPANTLYTWTVNAATGIGGTSAQPTPTSAPILQTLTNTTGADLQAVYTVMPTAGTSAGSPFTITVTVHSTPAPTTTDYTASCLLTGTGNWADLVTATGTLNWYDNPADIMPIAAPTTFDKNSLASNRSYWVTQVLNGCESPKAEVKVNISSNPQPAQVSAYAACATTGAAITWESLVQTPAASLLWYSADSDASLLASEPAAIDPNTVQQASNWVIVVDAQGCKGQRTEVKATVYALPASTVAKVNDVSCPSGSDGAVQLVSVDAGTAPYTYSWRNAQNLQVSTATQTSALSAGVYTLTVTDSNNCVATSAPITIADTPDTTAPSISGTVPSAQASNANDCIFRIVDFTAAVRAISSDNCTPQASLTVTQQPTVGTAITQDTNVIVTVRDASGNETTTTVVVTLPQMPTITFDPINPLCANAAPVALQGSNSGSFAGTYAGAGVVGTQFDPSVAGVGTHVITYTIHPYGCAMTETQTVVVYPVPEGIVIETPSVCPGDALNFTATAGYGKYEWTIDGVLDNTQTGNGYAYGAGTTSGQQIQIQLTVVSDQGCRSLPISAEANVKTNPSIALVQQPVFCVAEKGTTIRWRDLVVANERQVRWYETETSTTPVVPDNIDRSVTGQYKLYAAAVSTNGCLSNYRLPVEVTVNENPQLETLDKSDLDNIKVTIAGGAKPYIYDIEGVHGSTDGWINLGFLPIGKHYLLVTDTKGCQAEITVPIVEYNLIPDEYFSPNDDGKQDLWTIKNLDKYLDANIKISVFDRTGKELARYDAHEFKGWDGKYAGKDLPSTDYWYLIRIDKTGDQMAGHFSLKR